MAHERILVLEDSDEVRAIVTEMLGAYGFVPVPGRSPRVGHPVGTGRIQATGRNVVGDYGLSISAA